MFHKRTLHRKLNKVEGECGFPQTISLETHKILNFGCGNNPYKKVDTNNPPPPPHTEQVNKGEN